MESTTRTNDGQPGGNRACVALDPHVQFSQREIGGRTMFIAHHPALGKYFQLGPEEHRVANLLNGQRGLREILDQLEAEGIQWRAEEVADFVSRLVSHKLASMVSMPASESATEPVAGSAQDQPRSATAPGRPAELESQPVNGTGDSGSSIERQKQQLRILRALSLLISQRIPLINGDRLASAMQRRVGKVFSPVGMLCWAGLVASGLIIVVTGYQDFSDELVRMFDPSTWLMLLLMWVVAKVVHESGHAIAARYHGVRVGKVGVLFFFLAPLAFVDVTDAWKLKWRWSRVQIALAGVYLELGAAALAAWAWCLLPDGYAKHLAAQFVIVAGPATLLVNANPLLRLDGYYVLSDLTEIPNLRMHGRRQLLGALESFLLKSPPIQPLISGWRRTFATVHAFCSCLFQAAWMTGLVIGVSAWAKGLGMIMGAAAVLMWVVLPLCRWFMKVWMSEPGGRWYLNTKRKRLLSHASLLLLLCQFFATTNSPLARRVPVVVQFSNEQIARAPVDAFVRDVFVSRGQRVKEGTLLMVLEDPELALSRDDKADDLKIAELREVMFRRQGELSKSAAEAEKAASLRRQLAELDAQVRGLAVVAERSGLVVGAEIQSLHGRFVQQGTELIRVSDPQEKELLVSVGESDVQAFQDAASLECPATVRLRGGQRFSAVPAELRPRANQSLPHRALSATAGGPLAVEPSPNEDEQMRTVEPQLESVTSLDPLISAEIEAGQIGMMTVADNRSLFARVYSALLEKSR